jgi:hypothetical protein
LLVPSPPLLLLSLSSLSTIIAEENIAGGVLLSTDANLGAIPFDKEDVNNVDNNGVMVAAVIATPDTMGGNVARDAIVLALSSLTRRTLISILLVMYKKSSLNNVDL